MSACVLSVSVPFLFFFPFSSASTPTPHIPPPSQEFLFFFSSFAEILRHIHQKRLNGDASEEQAACSLVASILFLRFITRAIITPEIIGLANSTPYFHLYYFIDLSYL
jgi:hypothetical protein